jgi:hypothetical protein
MQIRMLPLHTTRMTVDPATARSAFPDSVFKSSSITISQLPYPAPPVEAPAFMRGSVVFRPRGMAASNNERAFSPGVQSPGCTNSGNALKSSFNAGKPPCAVTEKTPGTEIANVYAGCAAVPDVPAIFTFSPLLSSVRHNSILRKPGLGDLYQGTTSVVPSGVYSASNMLATNNSLLPQARAEVLMLDRSALRNSAGVLSKNCSACTQGLTTSRPVPSQKKLPAQKSPVFMRVVPLCRMFRQFSLFRHFYPAVGVGTTN